MDGKRTRVKDREQPSLLRDTGGATFVEYVALVAFVTLIGAAAIVAVGVPLLKTFRYAQLVLAMPIP